MPPPLIREHTPPVKAVPLRPLWNIRPLKYTMPSNQHPGNQKLGERGGGSSYVREKLDEITLLSDVVLPVFHEVLQSYQWILHDWHHIFRGPGLHGNQHDPRVQLFLVDLGGRRKKTKQKQPNMPINLPFCCHDTCTEPLWRTCVFWDKSSEYGTKITLVHTHARTHTHGQRI